MGFSDKFKRERKPDKRASEKLMKERLERLHPGESPRSVEALIERIKEMKTEVWER